MGAERARRRTGPFLAALAAGALALAAGAQDDAPTFEDAIDVRVVTVDVTVTDRTGEPLTGLAAGDFEVEIDGDPVEVSNFYEESIGLAPASPGAPAIGAAGEATSAKSEDVTEAPAAGATDPSAIVVHFDNATLRPHDRDRALEQIALFLERARAATGAPLSAVSASRTRGLRLGRLPEPLTAEALAAGFRGDDSGAILALAQRRSAMRSIAELYEIYEDSPACEGPCDCAWSQMLGIWDLYAAELGQRFEQSMAAVDEVVASLGAVEGRKALVLVSSGLEQRPGLDVLEYLCDVCPEYEREFRSHAFRHDLTGPMVRLAASANANRVTIHTLDAGGATTTEAADVSYAEPGFRPSRQTEAIFTSNVDAGLAFLARDTGGQAVLNTNLMRPDDTAPVERSLRHYYSLGLRLAAPPDDRTHRVDVRLARKIRGAELAYRRQFTYKPPTRQDAEATLAALHWGAGANPLGIRLAIGPGPSTGDGGRAMHVLVPGPELALPETTRPPDLPILVAVHDLDLGTTILRRATVPLEPLGPDDAVHDVVVDLGLQPGSYRFAVAVRHPVDGTLSFARLDGRVE